MSSQHRRRQGVQHWRLVVSFLCLLSTGAGVWAPGIAAPADRPPFQGTAQRPQILVQAGRLSVDLQEVDLGEVLAQIGRQAGIRVAPGAGAGKRISLRFAGLELEEGLRRLLRAASLSHLFLYAQGPTGAVTVTEVRVFGEGKESSPRPGPALDPLRSVEDPPPGPMAGRKSRRPAGEVVEPVQAVTTEPETDEPTELTRRIREVFQQSQAMKGSPKDGQSPSTHEPMPAGDAPGGVGGSTP